MTANLNFDEQTEKVTGRTLSEKWNVQVSHALYRENGMWYHMLKRFPGALFDQNGYVRFETEQDFLNRVGIDANLETNQVHVQNGISKITGYVRMTGIVQDDADTDEEVDSNNDEINGAMDYGEIDVREDNQTIFEWARKLDRELIITDPDFQRNVVWKLSQKSQFIESVLLNIPLPPIYVNQNAQGKYILVDGLQRTTTLYEFIKGKFRLSGLIRLRKLNGHTFQSLDPSYQIKIEDRKLFVFVIKPSASLDAIYDIFYRINTGGTQLNRQEIRNCLYIGESTRLLKSLAESTEFTMATDNGFSPIRMKDREAVLRCIAFANFDYENDYRGDMDEFLGHIMEELNKRAKDLDFYNRIRQQFLHVMQRTYDVYGEANFRPPTDDGRNRINIALMESVYRFFALKEKGPARETNNKRLLRNYELLCKDTEFIDAIQRATSGRQRVLIRFNKAMEILGA
jgi:hypothetical protein